MNLTRYVIDLHPDFGSLYSLHPKGNKEKDERRNESDQKKDKRCSIVLQEIGSRAPEGGS
jgi:hypothetical protein